MYTHVLNRGGLGVGSPLDMDSATARGAARANLDALDTPRPRLPAIHEPAMRARFAYHARHWLGSSPERHDVVQQAVSIA